jgi:hypothetical protein
VLILVIDYTAPGHATLGTAPIGYEAWMVALPFLTAMLLLEEARKAFVRWREASRLVGPDGVSDSEPVSSS